jgi:uncharacterized membrane protein
MGKDVGDAIGEALGRAVRDTVETVSANARKASKKGSLSGAKGVAAGAGLAAVAPLATRGAGWLVKRGLRNGLHPVKAAGDKIGGGVKDAVGKSVDQAGGAAGLAKEAGKDMLPGGGRKSSGVDGVGKGRRMPIQQAVDVAVPISTAYNQWTQFEEWPKFMHRLERVTQDDECHVSFKLKIWGISKEFKAEIVEQRPDERIKWRVTEGLGHTGVITFHELADRLTRIEVNIDVHPDSLIEKAGRGMRHAKRAVRAELARFKAYIEMEEDETGAWRGEIDDGAVKKKSSPSRAGASSSGGGRSRVAASRSGSASGGRSRRSGSSSKASSGSGPTRKASSGSGTTRKTSSGSGRSKAKSSSNGSRAASPGTRASSSGRSSRASSDGPSSANRSGGSRSRRKSGAAS